MRRRLVHPMWGHLPAILGLIGFAIYSLATADAWPAQVPLNTSWEGEPYTWGSPWIGFAIVIGIGLIFIAVSVVMDEMWARQEGKKRFNAFAVLDEAIIGWLAGTQLAVSFTATQETAAFPYPWGAAILGAGLRYGVR